MTDLDVFNELLNQSPRVRRAVKAYIFKAYQRGVQAGERVGRESMQVEFDELLARIDRLGHMNGSTELFKTKWAEAKGEPSPRQAMTGAEIDRAVCEFITGTEPTPRKVGTKEESIPDPLPDPDKLPDDEPSHAIAAELTKAFKEEEHPREVDGKFAEKEDDGSELTPEDLADIKPDEPEPAPKDDAKEVGAIYDRAATASDDDIAAAKSMLEGMSAKELKRAAEFLGMVGKVKAADILLRITERRGAAIRRGLTGKPSLNKAEPSDISLADPPPIPVPVELPPVPPAPIINVTLPAINITMPATGGKAKLRRAKKNHETGEWVIEELEEELEDTDKET